MTMLRRAMAVTVLLVGQASPAAAANGEGSGNVGLVVLGIIGLVVLVILGRLFGWSNSGSGGSGYRSRRRSYTSSSRPRTRSSGFSSRGSTRSSGSRRSASTSKRRGTSRGKGRR